MEGKENKECMQDESSSNALVRRTGILIENEEIIIDECLILTHKEYCIYANADKDKQTYKAKFNKCHLYKKKIKWYEFREWYRVFKTVYNYLCV